MNLSITPSPLTGTVAAIPSKSAAHRFLICSALADMPTELTLPSSSEDIDATIGCIKTLGADVVRASGTVTVTPVSKPVENPVLDCRESGSTLRFMLPVASAMGGHISFTGRGRLPDRPIGDLVEVLKRRGVSFSSDTLPFEISGILTGGEFALPGNISSQYITGLLLALPKLEQDSTVRLTTKLVSSAYVNITLSVIERFGVRAERSDEGYYFIPGNQTFVSPGRLPMDGDWSSAAFFLAAGAIGCPVTVTGLNPDSPQGDKAVVGLLRRFGANVVSDGDCVTASPGRLRGCEIDLGEVPDLLPALAVVAACAEGETRFVNGSRLQFKESDRLLSAAAMIQALGGKAEKNSDGLTVRGGGLSGGTVKSCGDHRIAMAAAIAGISCSDTVTILGAEAINKSYPAFFSDYSKLGGKVCVL